MKPTRNGSNPYLSAILRPDVQRALLQTISAHPDRQAPLGELLVMRGFNSKDVLMALQNLLALGQVSLSGPPLNQVSSLTDLGAMELGLQSQTPICTVRPSAAASDQVRNIADELEQRIKKVFAGPVLGNYDGWLHIRAQAEGQTLTPAERLFSAPVGQSFRLLLSFEPARTGQSPSITETISISDGENRPDVAFQLEIDSDTLSFTPRIAVCSVNPGAVSEAVTFSAVLPAELGDHLAWVQVFQLNRLLQTAEIQISALPHPDQHGG